MTAGWCSRAFRAAVFAAVCVLLAALGHVLMSGTAVPWWSMAAATAITGGAAWLLAGRERGPVPVGSAVVAVQAALHSSFSLAQVVARPAAAGSGSLGRRWADVLLCRAHPGAGAYPQHTAVPTSTGSTGSMHHPMESMHSMGSMDAMGSMGSMDPAGAADFLHHTMGGLSSTGMLAAHLLAALLCGLWLAHGERAAFRILRALAGWAVAPLRLLLLLPAPPHRPRLRVRRGHTGHVLRQLFLTRAITSRGPPEGTAVA
ncbi:hypothetical protein [Streptomyces sp. MMBL 11-3]|uniref:hypothetical protein n=1 Tax=Streptomyces sp. MMBL 11-3 TaxID=3382639 RepID=UPI0039B4C49C